MSTHPRKQALSSGRPGSRDKGVPTGSLGLDLKLGSGGWPRGRIVEIYGPEGAGKTTMLLEAIAQVQHNGGFAAFIDADHGMDQPSAERLKVNLETMPFHRTNCLEDAFEKIEELVQGGEMDVIALDSIAALVRENHQTCSRDAIPLKKDEEHQHRIEHFLKALLGPLSRSRAVLLITNQIREKLGVMYGNPETIPWQTSPLRDFASVRVDLRRGSLIKDGQETVGTEVKAKIVKNRLAVPAGPVQFNMLFATGIWKEAELITVGLEAGLLKKQGAYLYFEELTLGKGQIDAQRHLREDGELAARLRAGIIARLSPENPPPPDEETP